MLLIKELYIYLNEQCIWNMFFISLNQERPVRQGRSFLAVCCWIINFALYYSSVRVQYRRLSISYGSSSSVYNPAVKSI